MGIRPCTLARGVVNPDKAFWTGKRVLLTGHTGFKGAWMTLLLHRLGAQVCGYSLDEPVTTPCLFEAAGLQRFCEDRRGDIRDLGKLSVAVTQSRPDVLIHMAAQPIVRTSLSKPLETFDVNVMGVAKVLEAARGASNLAAVVIVTSDKCYENRERIWPYREDEAMGGSDPYSASKGAAELVTTAYARTFFAGSGPAIVSVRAGNVIGGGDWAADRLIPDLVRASMAGERVHIRSPGAIRPWQHVLDPLNGYLLAAQRACNGGSVKPHDAWNFGPTAGEELSVREVVQAFRAAWRLPLDVEFASETPAAVRQHREADLLRVDSTKAKTELGWRASITNEAVIQRTATWYMRFLEDNDCESVLKASEDEVARVLHASPNHGARGVR